MTVAFKFSACIAAAVPAVSVSMWERPQRRDNSIRLNLRHPGISTKNFALCLDIATSKVTAMSGIFASLALEGKRIRPEKPVIKGGIFPSTSR